MDLIKITCELKFSERIRLLSGYEALYKDIRGKAPEHPEQWIIPGLKIDDSEKKLAWLVDPARSVIDIEQPSDIAYCKDYIIQFFSAVHKRIGIPSIARYGLRSTWIKEYRASFQDFLQLFKQKLYTNSKLSKRANDVGTVMEYTLSTGKKLTLTAGPMESKQLKQEFLHFEAQSIPDIFLYADIDMGDMTTKGFSAKYLGEFVSTAISEGQKLASEMSDTLGV